MICSLCFLSLLKSIRSNFQGPTGAEDWRLAEDTDTQESHMKNLVSKFAKDESGATAIEYGLIAGLIAIAIIAGGRSLGQALNTKFSDISKEVAKAK